jgi:hypothetical protein
MENSCKEIIVNDIYVIRELKVLHGKELVIEDSDFMKIDDICIK